MVNGYGEQLLASRSGAAQIARRNEGCEGSESAEWPFDHAGATHPCCSSTIKLADSLEVIARVLRAHQSVESASGAPCATTGIRGIRSCIQAFLLAGPRLGASASRSNSGMVAFHIDVGTRDNYSAREQKTQPRGTGLRVDAPRHVAMPSAASSEANVRLLHAAASVKPSAAERVGMRRVSRKRNAMARTKIDCRDGPTTRIGTGARRGVPRVSRAAGRPRGRLSAAAPAVSFSGRPSRSWRIFSSRGRC